MLALYTLTLSLTWCSVAAARHIFTPPVILPRTVAALDSAAAAEAQPRDDSATRAFSNAQITTADGRCLFVDKLSGDFRENLTPVQVAACGSTDGQGWDLVTAGKHNNVPGAALVVSTLTNACLNYDPRRAAGNQVLLFSCGGRADGGGDVTSSQLFALNGTFGPLSLTPENAAGSCVAVKGNVLDIASCNASDASQKFTFGSAAATLASTSSVSAAASSTSSSSSSASFRASSTSLASATASTASTASTAVTAIAVPATAVPVSRGGSFSPSAAAEANPHDATATRAFSAVAIRAASGQCLFADPTAGDFRANLVPVSLVACAGTPNEMWDVITAGAHNDVPGTALIVSTLTNGCISFDSRRAANDTVNLFSCGGRADGSGKTNADQLVPFVGALSFAFAPTGENNSTCILSGDSRLVSGACPTDGAQLFSVMP